MFLVVAHNDIYFPWGPLNNYSDLLETVLFNKMLNYVQFYVLLDKKNSRDQLKFFRGPLLFPGKVFGKHWVR